jgi:hypothetical protein
MRYVAIILLILIWQHCLSQTDYNDRLSLRLDQIKKLEFYINDVVVHIDSVDYHDLSYPYWDAGDTYYQYDVVRYKNCQYEALTDDTRDHRPDTSRAVWTLMQGPHPYLFLRDTASLEDLYKLMLDEHPYIRTYTFGALSFRNSAKLFPLIIDNLADTTQMEVAGCVFSSAYPADLMIEYEAAKLTKREKRKLVDLINSRYKYLTRGLDALKIK